MSGRHRSKPAREIFLTSSSLSFSSLSSSTIASWDDAIELNNKASRPSFEEQNVSELSSVETQVRMQPVAPSPPLKLRPAQLKNTGIYDPDRIPASVFAKTVDLNWSEVSNDSLFSLKMDGCRMSNFRQSNVKPEDLFMSGEFLAYSPFLSVKLEDPDEEEENISEIEEIKSGEVEVTIAETLTHQMKSSFSAPDVLCSTKPSKSYSKRHYLFGQAPPPLPPTKVQPFTLPVVEKRSKKRKQTVKSKQKKKMDKKKTKYCILSWLSSSRSSKDKSDLCCFKWRKCCCYCPRPKALV